MREVTLEELLEAGCHFGHQVTRSNPRARDFIYEERDNIHIIDLVKTKQYLEEAAVFIKSLAKKTDSSLIVVGTKRQAGGIVGELMRLAQDQKAGEGLFHIVNRWVGGLLTNFNEVSKNFEKLKAFSENLQNEEFRAKYTKKEIGLWTKEKEKLENLYAGVASLAKKPDALFIIDSHLENLAVREAMQMGVTTVGIVDTNANPDVVDYPIPANDDAVGSIKLITSYIIDSWIEGRQELSKMQAEDKGKAEKESKEKSELESKKEEEKTISETTKSKSKTQEKEDKDVKRKHRTTKKTP